MMFFLGDNIYKRKLDGIVEKSNIVVCWELIMFIIFFVEYGVISGLVEGEEVDDFVLVRIILCFEMLIRIFDL